MNPRIGGVILCGGESRRMGRAKAWLPFGGTTMLEHVFARVSMVCQPIVVVAAPGQDLPERIPPEFIVRDEVTGRGPLQGLAAGFAALPDDVAFAFATATDVPFLEPAWISRLANRIGPNDLAIPEVDGYLHPLAALYRRAPALQAIRTLLAQDRLRPIFLRESLATVVLGPNDFLDVDPCLGTLRNLNTPDDYEKALHEFEQGPGRG